MVTQAIRAQRDPGGRGRATSHSGASMSPVALSGDDAAPSSDGMLLTRACHGDKRAWEVLVRRHSPVLWTVARSFRLSEVDAADAIQTTWLRCIEHADRIYAPDRLRYWLLTTCRRECLRLVRSSARDVPTDVADPAGALARLPATDRDENPAERVVHLEIRSALRDAVADLSPRQRDVVSALFLPTEPLGHGYAAIAERLRLPVGSLGPTRERALGRLRRDGRVTCLMT